MLELESYFESAESPLIHPLIRRLNAYVLGHSGATIAVRVDREHNGLVYGEAKLVVLARLPDATRSRSFASSWDNDLNQDLVRLGYVATNRGNEILRFMLSLRASLKTVEVRYGNGFFNSAIVMFVASSPFFQFPRVSEVLESIRRTPLRPDTVSYRDCTEMIDATFRSKGHDLKYYLHYNLVDCETILSSAIAEYLDERFSVSNRKLLGWA